MTYGGMGLQEGYKKYKETEAKLLKMAFDDISVAGDNEGSFEWKYKKASEIVKLLGMDKKVPKENTSEKIGSELIEEIVRKTFLNWNHGPEYWYYWFPDHKDGYRNLFFDEYSEKSLNPNDVGNKIDNYFDKTILYHAALSAYDAITIYIDLENEEWSSASDITGSDEWSSEEYALLSKVKKRVIQLENYGLSDFFIMKGYQVLKTYEHLFNQLLSIDGRITNTAFKIYKCSDDEDINKLKKWLMTLYKVYDQLVEEAPIDDAERILYLYRLEDFLGLRLANRIVGALIKLKEENEVFPDGVSQIRAVSFFGLMPNTLSRGDYAQYAFDLLWQVQKKNKTGQAENERRRKEEQVDNWCSDTREKALENSQLFFPLVQWGFMINLFDAYGFKVEKSFDFSQEISRLSKDKKIKEDEIKGVTKTAKKLKEQRNELNKEKLLQLQKDLKAYIIEHANEIEDTIKPMRCIGSRKEEPANYLKVNLGKKENKFWYEWPDIYGEEWSAEHSVREVFNNRGGTRGNYCIRTMSMLLKYSTELKKEFKSNYSIPELSKDKWFPQNDGLISIARKQYQNTEIVHNSDRCS